MRKRRLTNSYIIVRGKKMPEPDRWLEPQLNRKYWRLLEIQKMQSHIPNTCPECGEPLTVDDEQVYCNNCGLVCLDSTEYTAGLKYTLPYGLKLG